MAQLRAWWGRSFRSLGGALRNPGSAVGEATAVRAPPPSWIAPGGLSVSGDGGVYRWIVVWLGRRWRHSPEGRAEDRGPRAEGALGADRCATCGCRPYIVGYRFGVARRVCARSVRTEQRRAEDARNFCGTCQSAGSLGLLPIALDRCAVRSARSLLLLGPLGLLPGALGAGGDRVCLLYGASAASERTGPRRRKVAVILRVCDRRASGERCGVGAEGRSGFSRLDGRVG